jgi:hypothetical protein
LRDEKFMRSFGHKTCKEETAWGPVSTGEHSIKIDLVGIKWKGMDWICLAWDRDMPWALVTLVVNLEVPE